MLCNRCKKRMAVVFVSNGKDPKPQGLCTVCAKELGLTQVNDMMKQMGITDEMLEEANDQLTELMNGGDPSSLFGMMGFQNPEASGEEDEEEADGGDDFEMGGTPTFPKTLQELFGGMQGQNNDRKADSGKKPPKPPKKEQPPKRKYLDAYCENLTRKARAG